MFWDTKTRRHEQMGFFFFACCFSFLLRLYICVCTSLHTCVPSTQVKLRSVFSPATRWVPGIKHQVNTPGIFYLHPSWLSRSCGLCLPIGFLPHGGHSAFRYWGREEGSATRSHHWAIPLARNYCIPAHWKLTSRMKGKRQWEKYEWDKQPHSSLTGACFEFTLFLACMVLTADVNEDHYTYCHEMAVCGQRCLGQVFMVSSFWFWCVLRDGVGSLEEGDRISYIKKKF